MHVFVLHRDIAHEFGEVWGVFSVLSKAIEQADLAIASDDSSGEDDWSILDYVIDGSNTNIWRRRKGNWMADFRESTS